MSLKIGLTLVVLFMLWTVLCLLAVKIAEAWGHKSEVDHIRDLYTTAWAISFWLLCVPGTTLLVWNGVGWLEG